MHSTTTITRLFQAVLVCLTTHTSVHNILVISTCTFKYCCTT